MTDKATAKGVSKALREAFPLAPGDALAGAFAPDGAADATLDRLAEQLRSLPWPAPQEKEPKQ